MNYDNEKNLVKPNNALLLMWIKLSTILIYNFVTMPTQMKKKGKLMIVYVIISYYIKIWEFFIMIYLVKINYCFG